MNYKFVQNGTAETYNLAGGEITRFLLTGSDTENQVSVYDSILPKGNFAPMHYHEIDSEIFYIINGEVEFRIEGETIIAKKGDIVMAGAFVKRSFKALTDAHLIVINTPGGPSEGFLRDIARLQPGETPSAELRQKFAEIYKIHIVEN
ncbi:cupin domain-containing protein [Aquella oligotrophica]|uniref:Cupin domain-containing protein n=1 Tax=Aquella oligotrophica TaxID=2067065 RepID=A0A2I7N639_9NEIS|nr:cupin domain-containing protein [Aquella oligotrophica]AUR51901.1 cupin domain-containing protein [Aquella oligotrophica]